MTDNEKELMDEINSVMRDITDTQHPQPSADVGEALDKIDDYIKAHKETLKCHPDAGVSFEGVKERNIMSDFHSKKHALAEFIRLNHETIRQALTQPKAVDGFESHAVSQGLTDLLKPERRIKELEGQLNVTIEALKKLKNDFIEELQDRYPNSNHSDEDSIANADKILQQIEGNK